MKPLFQTARYAVIASLLLAAGCASAPKAVDSSSSLVGTQSVAVKMQKHNTKQSNSCRGAYRIGGERTDAQGRKQNVSVSEMVVNQFVRELRSAKLFDPRSKDVVSVKMNEVDFQSFKFDKSSVTSYIPITALVKTKKGVWVIDGDISLGNQKPINVRKEYVFDSALGADKACARTVEAFKPAMHSFLAEVYSQPEFKSFVTR